VINHYLKVCSAGSEHLRGIPPAIKNFPDSKKEDKRVSRFLGKGRAGGIFLCKIWFLGKMVVSLY
jgi:hypothetical protein